MVKQYSGTCKHVVSFAVLFDDPVSVLFCDSVGRIRMERSLLALGNLLNLSVKLGSGCLIDSASIGKPRNSYSLKHPENTYSINVCGKLGNVKRNLNVALRRKVIDLVRSYFTDKCYKRKGIGKIAVMKSKIITPLKMCDSLSVFNGRSSDDTVNLVSFLKQKLCKITSVLSGDTGDKCFFHLYSTLDFFKK